MHTKNKILEAIGVTLAVLAIAGLITFILSYTPPAKASGVALSCADSSQYIPTTTPGYNMGCAPLATTTQVYLGVGATGATTTIQQANIVNAKSLDFNLYVKAASSTTSAILWQYFVSNDGLNWYPLDAPAVSGTVTTHNATSTNVWIPGGTGPALLSVHVSNLSDRYFKVNMSGSTASSSVYTQTIIQNEIPN